MCVRVKTLLGIFASPTTVNTPTHFQAPAPTYLRAQCSYVSAWNPSTCTRDLWHIYISSQ